MKNFGIITDAISDISEDVAKKLDVAVIPFLVILDEKQFLSNQLNALSFYSEIKAGKLAFTSQINPEIYVEVFSKFLEKNEDIIYICGSSGITNTINSAKIAVKELKDRYPDNKIFIVDSLCASLGQALLVHKASEMKKNGKSIDQIYEWTENNKLKICHWFSVDDLHHLKRGGRISSTAAFFGSMIGIKPILRVNNEGKLEPFAKVRGRKAVIESFIKKLEESEISIDNKSVYISHSDSKEEAEKIASIINEKFNPKEVIIDQISPVIGTHTGAGTLAIFFMNKKR